MTPSEPDFYIGWAERAPVTLAGFVRRRVACLLLASAALAVTLALVHRELPIATFEYGVVRSFEGRLDARPVPRLWVERLRENGTSGANGPESGASLLLGVFGKHGAAELVGDLDGHRVRLQGSLAYRAGQTTLEVADASIEDLGPGPASAPPRMPLGSRTLVGEIVDSKCWMGVMNPGNLKPHRACAARCISGGIPPVLCVRGDNGAAYLLLVGADGRSIGSELLDVIAESVEVTGEVERDGDLLVLRCEPANVRRLSR